MENFLHKIVSDPLFDLFITFCIVINTLFLALEHHNMPQGLKITLDVGNYVSKEVDSI